MRIHSEETLDELSDNGPESLWEFDTCNSLARIRKILSDTTPGGGQDEQYIYICVHTYTGGKQLFVVDVVLRPGH